MLVISATHGLGAIGKTTVAVALAHNQDVRQRFSDGVLWVSLGQQSAILDLLNIEVDHDRHHFTRSQLA